MGTTIRKRRTVGAKRRNIVDELMNALPEIEAEHAAALAMVAAIFGDVDIQMDGRHIVIRNARLCVAGHLTKNR